MTDVRFHCRTCDRILVDGDWVRPSETDASAESKGPVLTCRFCTMEMSLTRHRLLIDKLRLRPLDIAGSLHLIATESSARKAATEMAQRNISLLGCVRDDTLVGVISERDITRRVAAEGLNPNETRINTVMSSPVQTINDSASLAEAIVTMSRQGCRHLVMARPDKSYRVVSARRIAETLFVVMGEAYNLGTKNGD